MKEIKIHKQRKKNLNATRKIALSFALVILTGSILLSLPITNKGEPTSYLNHLFIATSATCVTGLVPVVPAEQYNLFGQIVIMALIQIGGLGFLTFLSMFLVHTKKLTLQSKLTVQESLNITSLENLPRFLKNVIGYTFLFETVGAILLALVFVPEYGFIQGVYYGIFHAVSAFCNAGFDVLGANSLIGYQSNVIVNLTICSLIILGGIGFYVWFDVGNKIKTGLKYDRSVKKIWQSFELHSKLAISITIGLLSIGTLLFLLTEYDNALLDMNFFEKLLCSFFQSTTLRTAGFATVDYSTLNVVTKAFMCLLMFIGGSPAGTAGGIKTTTLGLMLAIAKSSIKGENHIHCFERRIEDSVLKNILTMLLISMSIVFCGILILSITDSKSFIDLTFEVFSAFATVGLSANYTAGLSSIGKITIILLMYIGRIGPVTMMLSFLRQSKINHTHHAVYPKGEILIG